MFFVTHIPHQKTLDTAFVCWYSYLVAFERMFADMAELAAFRANAAGGGSSERKMAQRSKFIGAPSRFELWAPQESRGARLTGLRENKQNLINTCGYGGTGRRARFRF